MAVWSVMTKFMWKMIKRTLRTEKGCDVFMSKENLKQEIKQMEFEYKCRSFKLKSDKTIQFL